MLILGTLGPTFVIDGFRHHWFEGKCESPLFWPLEEHLEAKAQRIEIDALRVALVAETGYKEKRSWNSRFSYWFHGISHFERDRLESAVGGWATPRFLSSSRTEFRGWESCTTWSPCPSQPCTLPYYTLLYLPNCEDVVWKIRKSLVFFLTNDFRLLPVWSLVCDGRNHYDGATLITHHLEQK